MEKQKTKFVSHQEQNKPNYIFSLSTLQMAPLKIPQVNKNETGTCI